MIKLPIFILLWVVVLAIKIPVVLLGPVAIAIMYRYRHVRYVDLPAWTRPWANPEDWEGQINSHRYSLPEWYIDQEGLGFRQFWRYHAIRNPANGLRSYEWLDLDVVPEKVQYKTNFLLEYYDPSHVRKVLPKVFNGTAWYFAWQGFRAGLKVVHIWSDERHLVIKFGWRVAPKDAIDHEVDELDEDASFATKFLFNREG